MGKLDNFIFGYRKISVCEDDTARATSLLLNTGINARVESFGEIFVRERDFPKCKKALGGRIRYTESEILGFPRKCLDIRCKIGVFVGIIISVLLAIYFSGIVWDVRIEGNTSIPDTAITEALEDAGFHVGSSWRRSDFSKIENKALSGCDGISWININRRGTVAYVSVMEKGPSDKEDGVVHSKYANIIATEDCVIEEIRVVRGVAEVKVGDVVKKGDLLISGLLPDSANGELCYAEGSVVGRVGDSIEVVTERKYSKSVPKKKMLNKISVKILNFSINIFKNSRNLTGEYDIIKDIDGFSIFGGKRLPFEIATEYSVVRELTEHSYSDKELVEITSLRLTEALSSLLSSSDLLRIKTTGAFTDTGYSMRADLVYLKEISTVLEFN